MILTCPQCHAQYDLDAAQLGARGRDVRCVSCGHVWFQKQAQERETAAETAEEKYAEIPAQQEEPEEIPAVKPDETVKQEDAAEFDKILSALEEAAPAPASPVSPPPPEAPMPLSGGKDKKALARQEEPVAPPIITHNPFGVGATAFGALIFLLCLSLTLGGALLFKGRVLHRYPQATAFYEMLGITVPVPGEGLRISDLVAERHAELEGNVLSVEGRMTNMTEREIAYPALRVVLSDARGLTIKQWDLKASAGKIAAGDIVPLTVRLPGAPDGGASVDVHVTDGQ